MFLSSPRCDDIGELREEQNIQMSSEVKESGSEKGGSEVSVKRGANVD